MIYLPSKKIIWLTIFLVVITIALLWFIGWRNNKEKAEKLERYYQEIIEKERSLEKIINQTQTIGQLSSMDDLATKIDWRNIEIKINSATGPEALKQYGLDISKALNVFKERRASEVEAVSQALNKNDSSELEKLLTSKLTHQEAVDKLKLVSTPKEMADLHKQLISNLENSILMLTQMERALTNPEIALEASRLFIQESLLFHQTLGKISNYLSSHKIEFTDGEKIKALFEF